jgi:hypothetical protein
MPNFKKIDVSGVLSLLIFVSAMLGLSVISDLSESYSISSDAEITGNPELTSHDEIVKAFNEIDTKLMSFFSDLRKDLAFL